jgi:glycosyltransferase involved in cell wall biosynthesis
MADEPELSRRMGLAGRRYLEAHFSRDKIAEKLLAILSEMTEGRK